MQQFHLSRKLLCYTHAWTKLHNKVMSWISGAYECHYAWPLPEANTTTVHDLTILSVSRLPLSVMVRSRAFTLIVQKLRLSEQLRWSQLWPVVGIAALGLSVRGNVFAPLYLLENPRGMRSRISLVCLGDAGMYSVLVAYTQLWDSGVVWTCASDMPSSWSLARTLITTVSLFVCYALGVIVTNDWCFLYCSFHCLYLMLHAYPLGQSHDQPLTFDFDRGVSSPHTCFSTWTNLKSVRSI